MKKLLFLLTVLLTLPIGTQQGLATDPVTTLVVLTKDKATHQFVLADKPNVTFEGTSLIVTSDKTTATFAISDIVRFTYIKSDVTGIDELANPGTGIAYQDGVLVISQVKAGESVSVYALDGRAVQHLKAGHAGTYRLPLTSLPFGVYLVKTGTLTYKITKR